MSEIDNIYNVQWPSYLAQEKPVDMILTLSAGLVNIPHTIIMILYEIHIGFF